MDIKADLETAWRALLNKAARPDGLQPLEWRLDLADEFGTGPLMAANTGEGPGAVSIAREWIAFLSRQNFEEGHSSDWDPENDEVGHCSWKGDLAGFPIVIWCLPDPEEH